MESTLGLRSQTFECMRENVLQTCLGVPAMGSFKKMNKNEKKKVVFLRKRQAIIDLFEGLWTAGTRFRH